MNIIKTIKSNNKILNFHLHYVKGSEKVNMNGKHCYMVTKHTDINLNNKYGYGISNITQKRCSCCGSVEKVTHFYNDSYSNDGYSSWCKSCVKTYSKNYREELKLVA